MRAINNVYSYATAIIAPSSALQKSIATKFPDYKNKVLHLPNPVDEDIFTFKEDKDDTSRVNFICVGLFRSEKNINMIIDSFATILKNNINPSQNGPVCRRTAPARSPENHKPTARFK